METKQNRFSYTKIVYNDFDIYVLNNEVATNIGIIHAGQNSLLFYPNINMLNIVASCKDAFASNESLKYVLINPDDIITNEVVECLSNSFPNVTFLSDKDTVARYQPLFPKLTFQIIGIGQTIKLDANHQLKFLITPFISQYDSFVIFDEKAHVLISNLLFSNPNNQKDATKSLIAFHEQRIPSSDFLHPLMKIIAKLNPQLIVPYLGEVLNSDKIASHIAILKNLTFYNSTYIVKKVIENRRFYNYINLGNQIITQLKNLYGENEVLSVFKDTDIVVSPLTLEIVKTPSNNYQFWHHLFNIIFDKKGPSWLAVLEKTVNKLNRLYNIKKPTVYKSSLVSSQFENIELQTQFSTLQENYKEVTEQLSRCPITKAFNESFFKNLLKKKTNDIVKSNSEEEWSILFVDIDNIRKLNLIHSKEIGDETIRNLYYLLNQVKDEDQEVFKRNGPGFILLCPHYDYDKSLQLAEKIRNFIETSDSFVEKITVSIAIARLQEFSSGQRRSEEIALLWFERGESRIKLAPSLGNNLIIDERTKNIVLSIGKILIIDNDEIIHNVFKLAFSSINYEVVIAINGLSAIEIVQTQRVDMIICEKNIPKLDGFQIKTRLNQTLETQMIPFILTTFNKNKEIVIAANELGIDVILTKPLIMEEVVGLVKRLTTKRVRL
ncbi:MAG: response regulator [Bacilli bacterium]